jgi:hypothetical protein
MALSRLPKIDPLTDQELHAFMSDHIIPPRFVEYSRLKAEVQRTCSHEQWTFKQHGRCCPECGIFMVDWGD